MGRFEKRWVPLVTILAILAFFGGGWWYLKSVQMATWDQSVDNVLEVTGQSSRAFEIYVDQGFNMLEGRCNNFGLLASSDEKAIGEMADLYEEGDPSFAVLDLKNGRIHFNSTQILDMDPQQLETYRALPDKGILEPFDNEWTGQSMIGYYERFNFSDGTPGLVRKGVPVEKVTQDFTLDLYGGQGSTYVVDDDGTILLRTGQEKDNRTFFNISGVMDLAGTEDLESLRLLEDGSAGVMKQDVDGTDMVFAFVPIDVSDGWHLVSMVPNAVIMEHSAQVVMVSEVFAAIVVTGVVLFVAVWLLSRRHQRQVQKQQGEVAYREQLFNVLANNTNDVFLLLSETGTGAEYVSPNIGRIMGLDKEAVKADAALVKNALDSGKEQLEKAALEAVPVGESRQFDGSFVHPATGTTHYFSGTVHHSTIEGLNKFLIVLSDRTEDRKKEAALQEAVEIARVANESKSTFLSNMSHDIRTPMNAVVGLGALLQRDAENPVRVREYTKKITASSQHLLGLINDVLDMSKIESGKTTLNISTFNLADLVEELNTIIRPQANAKNLNFKCKVQAISEELLAGDKLRLNQILINILSNAVKYTPEGGTVLMEVSQEDVGRNRVRNRFVISDTGMGMSEEFVKDLFQPFTREVRSTINQIQGTGLGMAITKSLIDLMGGTVAVKSELGKGTTFVVELDLAVQEMGEEPEFWKDNHINKILVVDDEEDVCQNVMMVMEDTGVAINYVLGGQDAIDEAMEAHRQGLDYDLILLDWKMPGMNGLETARHLRRRLDVHVPILILTSYGMELVRSDELEQSGGVDGYLPKPFFLSSFKMAIKNLQVERQLEKAPEAGKSLEGRRFLCAEDNPLNSEILASLLEMEGATSDFAVNGKEAVDLFLSQPEGTYDAILMDVQMPVMNGYEAATRIRSADKDILIVAMTANAFADDVKDALASGMDAHVAKPVNMTVLTDTLHKLWKKKNQ